MTGIPPAKARPRLDLIVILAALTAFSPMSIDMYLPALPTLAEAFAADMSQVQLTLASFFVSFALGQALYGPISDRFGRKPPLYLGLAVYLAASVGCAFAPNIEALIILRFLQALGACAGIVIARAMVRDLFPPQDAAGIYSLLMMVMGLAPIVAPMIGGYVLLWSGWQMIFFVLALFGLVCLIAVALRLPESHKGGPHHTLHLGSILLRYGRLLADRHYLGYALSGGVAMAGMFAYIAGSPFVFIGLHGVAAEHFGWFFGANACGIMLASQANRRLLKRTPAATVLVWGNTLQATAGLALLLCAATGFGGLWGIAVPLFFCVACIGLITPNTTALAMAPHGANAGVASALLGSLQFALAACGAGVMGVFNDGSAVPMGATVAVCSVLGMGFSRFLVPRAAA